MPSLPVEEEYITTVTPGAVSPIRIGVARNPLYPTQEEVENQQLTDYVNSISGKGLPLPVEMSNTMPTPFQVKQLPAKNVDTRSKEEKFSEMFGVVPGPEGELGIVQSIKSGFNSPGDIAQGNVANEMIETPYGALPSYLTRAFDTAGLGITGPLAMKPGTSTLNSGMKMKINKTTGVNNEPIYTMVNDTGKEIAEARLSHTGDYVVDLGVKPEFRRQGIASELYDHIENDLGKKLKPSPIHQTEAGKAFWEAREKGLKLIPVEGNPFELNPLALRAKEHFGITNNLKEAGYVLPDGSMLDLSGRHYDLHTYERIGDKYKPKAGQRDYNLNQRQVDHRELDFIDPVINKITQQSDNGLRMNKFQQESGAIRNMPGIGIDVMSIPTDKQLKVIVSGHNQNYRGDPLKIDVSSPSGEVIASKEFEKPNVENVKKFIQTTLKSDSGNVGSVVSNLTKQISDLQSQLIVAKKAGQDITGIRNQIKELNAQKQAPTEPAGIGHNNPPVKIPKDSLGFVHGVDSALARSELKTGTAEQWTNELKRYGVGKEELEHSVGELPKGQITRQQIEDHIAENKVQLQEHWKGELKFNEKSKYNLPEVKRAIREAGDNPGELELTLANDGNAYRALTKKFPELVENERWAEVVSNDLYGGTTKPKGTTKYSQYQMPGGSNYREVVMTLPNKNLMKASETLSNFEKQFNSKPIPAERKAEWEQLRDEVAVAKHGFGGFFPDVLKKIETVKDVQDARRFNVNFKETFKNYNDDQVLVFANRAKNGPNDIPQYTTSHWDEPNPVAHIRMNDRNIPNDNGYRITNLKSGNTSKIFDNYNEALTYANSLPESVRKNIQINEGAKPPIKTLHAEEIQSDWHQTGRKEGYKYTNNLTSKEKEELAILKNRNDLRPVEIERLNLLQTTGENGVPNAPFKSNWDELALKRLITKAVEEGYQAISWTPGRHQSTNPSKIVSEIAYNAEGKQKGTLQAFDHDKKLVANPTVENEAELIKLVGKEIADKLINKPNKTINDQYGRWHVVSGENLELGGTKEFYDRILVDKANKLVKQYGAKVEEKEVGYGGNRYGNKYGWEKGDDGRYYITTPDGRTGQSFATRQEAQHEMTTLMQDATKTKIPVIKLTPELKAKAKEGFNLFSAAPVIIPVDGNPFQTRQPKLTPVSFNPFKNSNDL